MPRDSGVRIRSRSFVRVWQLLAISCRKGSRISVLPFLISNVFKKYTYDRNQKPSCTGAAYILKNLILKRRERSELHIHLSSPEG